LKDAKNIEFKTATELVAGINKIIKKIWVTNGVFEIKIKNYLNDSVEDDLKAVLKDKSEANLP